MLVPKGHMLAEKESVTPSDLVKFPLLVSSRETVRNELTGWFGDELK